MPAHDAPTIQRLDAVLCLFDWSRTMPSLARKRFWESLADMGDEVRAKVLEQLQVIKSSEATELAREQALAIISQTLDLSSEGRVNLDAAQNSESQQGAFAERLGLLLAQKHLSQQELADRIGCSQPAVSQMLHRKRRPQKKTILKIAEALSVDPRDLWPDIEVVEMLDAVDSFQQEDYEMTEPEARAL